MWALILAGCSFLPPGTTAIDTATIEPLDGSDPPQAAGPAADVALSHAWNAAGLSGLHRYRMAFSVPPEARAGGWGLYLPRAGNRFHVWVNDRQVARFGALDAVEEDYAQQPHYVFIPGEVLRPGRNELRLDIAGEKARYAGLGRPVLGAPEDVLPLYRWRDALQTQGSVAVIAVSLLFALAALLPALRLRDRSLLLFCATCLLCAVRTSYAVVVHPPLPYAAWTLLTDACFVGYLLCLAAFCLTTGGVPRQPITALAFVLGAVSLVCLPIYAIAREAYARQFWLQAMVLFSVALCVSVIVHAVRTGRREAVVLAAAGVGAVALAIHDHVLVFYTREGYAAFALARYSLVLFLLAMGWLLLERRRLQESRLDQQRALMQAELAQHRLALERAFDERQALARQDAQQHERTRILYDIHDGMGLQLQSLLVQVEGGQAPKAELAHEVRTAIEQMRMLVSNPERFDGDVLMLFGQIRHQIERRLKVVGIALDWRVDPAVQDFELPGESAIALQRLVFELTTNVIRHSRARRMTLEVGHAAGGTQVQGGKGGTAGKDALHIRIADDGIGFDATAAHAGSGMGSIAKRVRDLGAEGRFVAAQSGGACFELRLASGTGSLRAA